MTEKTKENTFFLIAFFIIQVIIIAILISLIVIFKKDEAIGNVDYARQPTVIIEGLSSELPDVQAEHIGSIERQLANTISLNINSFDINNSKAIIRQDSLKIQKFENIEGYYFSIIVDIPNLQQSYQIYHHYPATDSPPNSSPPNVMYVLCLDSFTEKIYPDFHCRDNQLPEIRNSIAAYYLKYTNFEKYSAWINDDENSVVKITPINPNVSTDQKNEYIQKTKEFVSSLGISPNNFKYYVMEPSNYTYFNRPQDSL